MTVAYWIVAALLALLYLYSGQCHVEERVGLRGADAGGAGARPQSVTDCDYPARSGVVVALGCR